ncbi:NAD(P)H-dependent oxidoreductase [Clostridiaceae bacterium 35-E11]
MTNLYVIIPGEISDNLSKMVQAATSEIPTITITSSTTLPDLKNKKILFALELNSMGYDIPMLQVFSQLYARGKDALLGSSAGIFIHSKSELYTKSTAKNIIFLANQLGCSFIGHPIVEATKNLNNFRTWQKRYPLPLEEICYRLCKKLVKRLIDDNPKLIQNPKILALHSSSRKTSNTLMLWDMVKDHLRIKEIEELHVENGTVLDCAGCSFTACTHFSEQNSCFYGGIMVKEILPTIEKANAIIWLCPNYNDSISANLMAVINRLTSLYRKISLYDKTLFSIVVSGNSGSDSVAKQLIDALNINKGFRLPPYFTLMATANDPKTVKNIPMIEEAAKQFATNLMQEMKS